ncbi:MAG: heme-binding protein [Robiginitomaculum sp.]|nr:heme-binding protein [Robiginitomaculum sp.]
MLKAETASTTPRSTQELREIALIKNDPPHGIERIPSIVVFDGGVPIKTSDGYHLGGIGVSGATATDDGKCARAGVRAIKEDLKNSTK